MAKPLWNDADEKILSEKEFFLAKARVSEKIHAILMEVGEYLNSHFYDHLLIGKILKNTSYKISRGENLKGMPYFVLDVPTLKSNHSYFSFRIIVWWGNYITINLLLSGEHLLHFKDTINSNLKEKNFSELLISIADDAWSHPIDEKDYLPATKWNSKEKQIGDYFKATFRIPLEQMPNLEKVAESSCEVLLKLLK